MKRRTAVAFALLLALPLSASTWRAAPAPAQAREDAIEIARALHAKGRTEEAVRTLGAERNRAIEAGEAARVQSTTEAWTAIDPDSAGTLAAREKLAQRLAAMARADHAAGWTETAEESLALIRRLDRGTSRALHLELHPAPVVGAAPELPALRRWLEGADLVPSDTPFAVNDQEALFGPITTEGFEVRGERLPACYELVVDVVGVKKRTSFILCGGWIDPWTYDELYVSHEGDHAVAYLASHPGESKERIRSKDAEARLAGGEGLEKPLRITITRRTDSCSARIGNLEIPALKLAAAPTPGRLVFQWPASQTGAGMRVTAISVRDLNDAKGEVPR